MRYAGERGQALDLDVRIGEPAADGNCLPKHRFTGEGIWFGIGPDDQHPTMLGGVLSGLGEDPERSRQPSVLHCPVAEHIAGDPSQDPRHPGRRYGLPLPAVSGVRPFVLFDGAGVVALQVKRLTKTFSPAAGLDLSEGTLEGMASRRGVPGVQCRPAFFDHGRAHQT
jgi:hypothetical protein